MELTKTKYKQTEVGLIPEDWEVMEFQQLGSFFKGKGIRKDEVSKQGLPCIRYGELYTIYNNVIINPVSFISEEIARQSFELKYGDLLFAGSGETKEEIGKSAVILRENTYAGGDIVVFRPKNMDSKFLGYLSNSKPINKQKTLIGQGDAVVHIYSSGISKIKIPLPPLPEQKAIAQVLSDTDTLIQTLEQKLAKKRAIKQGAMQQLLTPKEDWMIKKLGEIAHFYNGKAHEQYIDAYGEFIVINSKFVSTSGNVSKNSTVNLSPLKKGDITMVMSDIPNGKALAKCFIVPIDNKYALNQRICAIRAETVDNDFLYLILNRNEYYLAFDSGTGQTNLKKNDVLECPIPLPRTKSEQIQIANILFDMDAEIAHLEQKLDKYKLLKQGLMQELLTGRIRLV